MIEEKLLDYVRGSLADSDGCEINPSNYDHDDVCKLNSAYCQLFGALEEIEKHLMNKV